MSDWFEATEKNDYNKMRVLSRYKFFILKLIVSAVELSLLSISLPG